MVHCKEVVLVGNRGELAQLSIKCAACAQKAASTAQTCAKQCAQAIRWRVQIAPVNWWKLSCAIQWGGGRQCRGCFDAPSCHKHSLPNPLAHLSLHPSPYHLLAPIFTCTHFSPRFHIFINVIFETPPLPDLFVTLTCTGLHVTKIYLLSLSLSQPVV